jgi:hypothetical protein
MKQKHYILLGLAIILAIGVISTLFPKHSSVGYQDGEYYIDLNYDDVRKIMVRNDCLSDMVGFQHGEVLHQEWDNLSFSSDRIISKWDIDGTGRFVVKTNHPDTGELILHFRQEVSVRKDYIVSLTTLVEPVGALKEHTTYVKFSRHGERTKVETSVKLVYRRIIPNNYREYMNEEVQASVDQEWATQKKATEYVINKYRNRRFNIPIIR